MATPSAATASISSVPARADSSAGSSRADSQQSATRPKTPPTIYDHHIPERPPRGSCGAPQHCAVPFARCPCLLATRSAVRFGLHAVLDGLLLDGLARYSGSVQRHAATATAERCASCTRPALVRRERNWMWRSPDGVYWRTRLCWEATHRLQPGTRHDDARSYSHRADVARRTSRSAALAVLLRLRRPSRSESPLGFHAASTWPAAAGCGFGNSDAGGLGCYAAVLRPPGARRSAGKTTRKGGRAPPRRGRLRAGHLAA